MFNVTVSGQCNPFYKVVSPEVKLVDVFLLTTLEFKGRLNVKKLGYFVLIFVLFTKFFKS